MEGSGLHPECEKVVVEFESKEILRSITSTPSTIDEKTQRYRWKRYDMMAYLLVPRDVDGRRVRADLYIFMDEDDLDDIDLREYTMAFLRDDLLRHWREFEVVHISDAVLASPEGIACEPIEL